MKFKLKIRDRNTNKIVDGDAIQMIEFSRDKARCFYTDEEGYTVYTNNFEVLIEFLPHEAVKIPEGMMER